MDVNHNNYRNNSVFLCISVTIDRLHTDVNSHINADGILTVVVAACVNSVWSGCLSPTASVHLQWLLAGMLTTGITMVTSS